MDGGRKNKNGGKQGDKGRREREGGKEERGEGKNEERLFAWPADREGSAVMKVKHIDSLCFTITGLIHWITGSG